MLFSYGSGLASAMFSLRVTEHKAPGSALERLVLSLNNLQQRLDSRMKVPPEEFDNCMKLREQTHHLGKLQGDFMSRYDVIFSLCFMLRTTSC